MLSPFEDKCPYGTRGHSSILMRQAGEAEEAGGGTYQYLSLKTLSSSRSGVCIIGAQVKRQY